MSANRKVLIMKLGNKATEVRTAWSLGTGGSWVRLSVYDETSKKYERSYHLRVKDGTNELKLVELRE